MKNLISIDSVNQSVGGSGETKIGEFVSDYMEKIGLDVHIQDVTDEKFNVIGVLKGEDSERSLMMNGHMDTVGVKGMIHSPFEPFIEDNKMHGRGACDMKGPIAAMIASAETLAKARIRLKGDIQISTVVDEEYMSLGTNKLLEEFHPTAAIVGEPTDMGVGIAHDGVVRLEVETLGKATHGSVPEMGIDAIIEMSKFVLRLNDLKKEYAKRNHVLVGVPKLHTSRIEGGSEWNIVPDYCLLKVEHRTIPGETSSMIVNEYEQLFEDLKKEDPSFEAGLKVVMDKQSMEIDSKEPVVKSLQKAFYEIRGFEPQIVGEPYWTDASLFVNKSGIPTCLFAPGDIRVAHSKNEYINIEDVVDAARIYAHASKNFLS
jgi:acetylornithine deacetylase/succinyl-diaminopimelate desuccinylase family protein